MTTPRIEEIKVCTKCKEQKSLGRRAGRNETVEIVKTILNREINILSQFRGDGYHDYAREYLEDIRKQVKALQDNK